MNSPLLQKSKNFSVKVIKCCHDLMKNKANDVLANQLLKSGTSIGANLHEANYAYSKADFASKIQISLKECNETEYWLEVLSANNLLKEEHQELLQDCKELKRMLVKACVTTKNNS